MELSKYVYKEDGISNYTFTFNGEKKYINHFGAFCLFSYIIKKDLSLEYYIGYNDENNNDGNNDFLLSCQNHDKYTLNIIMGHISTFKEIMNSIEESLEMKCYESNIENPNDFFTALEELTQTFKQKKLLKKVLPEAKTIKNIKL